VRTLRSELRALRTQGKCLLFSSHVMQEVAALCDRIVVMARGRVVAAGTAAQLVERAGTEGLEDAFVKLIGSDEGLAA
jgi:sodium transport system ATP-binding protein